MSSFRAKFEGIVRVISQFLPGCFAPVLPDYRNLASGLNLNTLVFYAEFGDLLVGFKRVLRGEFGRGGDRGWELLDWPAENRE